MPSEVNRYYHRDRVRAAYPAVKARISSGNFRVWLKSASGIRGEETADAFVGAAHEEPMTALNMLQQKPCLSRATASWDETALQAASHLGHRELIAQLSAYGVPLDIFAACATGDRRLVKSMLASTPADACGIHDLPLLHFGVVSRDVGMVDLLIKAGVVLDPPGASLSALHSAVGFGLLPMIRALVLTGANTKSTDVFGATALDWAYQLGPVGPEIVDLLGGECPGGPEANALARPQSA